MARITNQELINNIIVATDQDRIDWQSTAQPREFTASFGGKWTLVLSQWVSNRGVFMSGLTVKDSEGESVVRVDTDEDARIHDLHEMARRHAFHIDEKLADLLKEIAAAPKKQ